MSSAPAVDLELKRSVWRRRVLVGGYAVAALAWLTAGLHWLPGAAGVVALAVGLWRDARAPWPRRLSYRSGPGWRVGDSRRGVRAVPRVHIARTGRFVTSITWGAGPGQSLALFDDAFCDTGHKCLRRLLRHSHSNASC